MIQKELNKKGWFLAKNVFEKSEIKKTRENFLSSKDHPGDILSNPKLKNLILDPRIIDLCKSSLNSESVTYFGDSGISIDAYGRNFHKDSRDRELNESPDWDKDYSIIRMGIYLQDHSLHSGGLCLRENSHQRQSVNEGKIVNVRSEIGDVVIWKLTTTHSAHADLLKIFPNVSLHPKHALKLPKFFFQKVTRPRLAIFVTFGKDDLHLDRYIQFYKTRKYAVERILESNYLSEDIKTANSQNVKILDKNHLEVEKINLTELNEEFIQL